MKPILVVLALAATSLFAETQVSIGIGIGTPLYYPPPPPPVVTYAPPPCPGPGYVWVPGYWYPIGPRYGWRPGYWAVAPFRGAYWVAPRYSKNRYMPDTGNAPSGSGLTNPATAGSTAITAWTATEASNIESATVADAGTNEDADSHQHQRGKLQPEWPRGVVYRLENREAEVRVDNRSKWIPSVTPHVEHPAAKLPTSRPPVHVNGLDQHCVSEDLYSQARSYSRWRFSETRLPTAQPLSRAHSPERLGKQ